MPQEGGVLRLAHYGKSKIHHIILEKINDMERSTQGKSALFIGGLHFSIYNLLIGL
jgi:hypothetical protein